MTMTGTVTSSNPSRRFPFGCDVNVPDHNSHAPIQGAYQMILTAADRLTADSPIPTAIMLTHSKHMGRLMRFNEFLGKGSIVFYSRSCRSVLSWHPPMQDCGRFHRERKATRDNPYRMSPYVIGGTRAFFIKAHEFCCAHRDVLRLIHEFTFCDRTFFQEILDLFRCLVPFITDDMILEQSEDWNRAATAINNVRLRYPCPITILSAR